MHRCRLLCCIATNTLLKLANSINYCHTQSLYSYSRGVVILNGAMGEPLYSNLELDTPNSCKVVYWKSPKRPSAAN